jgi:putative DNA primase/helicase
VFPLLPRDKVPLLRTHGFKDATTDAATIRACWAATPAANVGGVPGPAGFVVLDLDGPEAEAEAQRLGLMAEPCPTVQTVRGRHLWFRHPGGHIGNHQWAIPGHVGDHIDVRANAGYVLMPPSVHPTGAVYEWLTGFGFDVPAPDLPPRVIEMLRAPAAPPPPPAPNGTGAIPEGQRNAALTSLAGSMRRRGLTAEELIPTLAAVNATRCQPPLGATEVTRIASSVGRYPAAAPLTDDEAAAVIAEAAGLDPESEEARERAALAAFVPKPLAALPEGIAATSDLGNAERLVRLYGRDVRAVDGLGVLGFDGQLWTPAGAERLAGFVGRQLRIAAEAIAGDGDDVRKARAAGLRHAVATQNVSRRRAMLDTVAVDPRIAATAELFDARPELLSVANGVLDLRTGELRESRRNDYMTCGLHIRFAADAACPAWEQHLAEIFAGDAALVGFFRRFVGYALTGFTDEAVALLLYGTGANGKTMSLRVLRALFGPLARTLPFTALTAKGQTDPEAPSPYLARLRGARLALAAESADGARFNEPVLKMLTGGDEVTARALHGRPVSFVNRATLRVATNYRPAVRGGDEGIWRRLLVLPFTVRFGGPAAPAARPERELLAELLAELPGIFAWAARGAAEWYGSGLQVPDACRVATAQYRTANESVAAFVAAECVQEAHASVAVAELRAAFDTYLEAHDGDPAEFSSQRFGRSLTALGFGAAKAPGGVRVRNGLRLSDRSEIIAAEREELLDAMR